MIFAAVWTGFRLASLHWLALLAPLALLMWWQRRRRRRTAVLFSDVRLVRALPRTWAQRLWPWVGGLRWLGLTLLIVALARPQQGRQEFRVETYGVAIQVCLDRSGSMQAMDFELDGKPVNRLTAVKRVFHDFVAGQGGLPGRPDDLIGLIAFGGFAESKCPLTLDHDALLKVLATVEIPQPIQDRQGRPINDRLLAEDQATAIGDAVTLAAGRLKGLKAKSRVIILLSDGEQTAGLVEPLEAARLAKSLGIKVYTIGIGGTGMAPIPVTDPFGRPVLRSVMVRLDEKTLRGMAEAADGRYFHARDTDALEKICGAIDRLEKSPAEGRLYTQYRELYQYVMIPAAALVLLHLLLAATRFRGLP